MSTVAGRSTIPRSSLPRSNRARLILIALLGFNAFQFVDAILPIVIR